MGVAIGADSVDKLANGVDFVPHDARAVEPPEPIGNLSWVGSPDRVIARENALIDALGGQALGGLLHLCAEISQGPKGRNLHWMSYVICLLRWE